FLGKTQPEAYNLGCLGHIASAVWLNVPVGVSAPIGTAKLEAGVGFEPAYPRLQIVAACHSPSPPLINSQRTSKFLLHILWQNLRNPSVIATFSRCLTGFF